MQQTIKKTADYSLFKRIGGNRNVDKHHVDTLVKRMVERDLKIPIVVNENMEVIDGQHRLKAREIIGLPVYYVLIEGLDAQSMMQANSDNKNWTMDDYLNSYIEQNFHHYKVYKEFKQRWGFGHSECITLLTGSSKRSGGVYNDFKNGEFGVSDLENAESFAQKIIGIEKFYSGARRRSFVHAMITALKMDSFNYEDFLNKLEYQSSKMVHCTNATQYLRLIEEIYNFNRQTEKRIHFK